MTDQYKEIMKQHVESYKNSILEIVNINTNVLVNEDIKSLLKKPPLDSMDVINSKFLSVAKKYQIILNTNELLTMLDKYRNYLLDCCEVIKRERLNFLNNKINDFDYKDDNNYIKINKKDFSIINKSIKKIIKNQLTEGYKLYIFDNIYKLFESKVDKSVQDKIVSDITKYIKNNYQKQILESLDIKILVKDTILINSCKEQTDRFIFTINNSRLLKAE